MGMRFQPIVSKALIDGSNADSLHVHDTAGIEDNAITAAKIAAAVAGDGLTGGAGSALAVGVDGTTVELAGDALRVKDGGISNAKLGGSITRANLLQEDLAIYSIPAEDFRKLNYGRVSDAVGSDIYETWFSTYTSTHGTDSPGLISNQICWGCPAYLRFKFMLPPEYVAGQAVGITVPNKLSAATATDMTLDCEVYKTTRNMGISGGDICTTSAIDVNSTGWATYSFTITPTTLSPGDVIDVLFIWAGHPTVDMGPQSCVGEVHVLLSIRG